MCYWFKKKKKQEVKPGVGSIQTHKACTIKLHLQTCHACATETIINVMHVQQKLV